MGSGLRRGDPQGNGMGFLQMDRDALRPVRIRALKVGAQIVLAGFKVRKLEVPFAVGVGGVGVLAVRCLDFHDGARKRVALRIDYDAVQGSSGDLRKRRVRHRQG